MPTPESRMLAVVEWFLTSFHSGRQVGLVWNLPVEYGMFDYCANVMENFPFILGFYVRE